MRVVHVCWLWGQMQPVHTRASYLAWVPVQQQLLLAGLPGSITSQLQCVPNMAEKKSQSIYLVTFFPSSGPPCTAMAPLLLG